MTFEKSVTKGEITRNEQFPLLPQCFLTPFHDLTFIYRGLPYFNHMFSKWSDADLLYVVKG